MPVTIVAKQALGNAKTDEIGETGKTDRNSKNGKNEKKDKNL